VLIKLSDHRVTTQAGVAQSHRHPDHPRAHLSRGSLGEGLVFDAVRVRLIEIGEAVKGLSSTLLEQEPTIPWNQIAGMRDRLAHRYFDTSRAMLHATVAHDLPELEQVVHRLVRLTSEE